MVIRPSWHAPISKTTPPNHAQNRLKSSGVRHGRLQAASMAQSSLASRSVAILRLASHSAARTGKTPTVRASYARGLNSRDPPRLSFNASGSFCPSAPRPFCSWGCSQTCRRGEGRGSGQGSPPGAGQLGGAGSERRRRLPGVRGDHVMRPVHDAPAALVFRLRADRAAEPRLRTG